MSFISYAQNFEDVMLWRALKHVENGFYIDVGANDPVLDSVTNAFYERGWRGINIEPLLSHHADLVAVRPRDINLQCAVGAVSGEIEIWEADVRGWATASDVVIAQHTANGHAGVFHKVPVTKLTDICAQHVSGHIHFLKIDVEGFEKSVIDGMDFSQFRPWILVIEATRPNSTEEIHEEWECDVLAASYLLAYIDGLNRFYVAQEHSELLHSLRNPPNVFDEFIRFEQLNSELRAQQAEVEAQQASTHTLQAEAQTQQAKARVAVSESENRILETQAQQANARAAIAEAETRILQAQVQAEAQAQQANARAAIAEAETRILQAQVQAEAQAQQANARAAIAEAETRILQAQAQAQAQQANARAAIAEAETSAERGQTQEANARADALATELASTVQELHNIHQANHYHWQLAVTRQQQLESTVQELHNIHQANHHHWQLATTRQQQLESTAQELHNIHQANHHHWQLAATRQQQIAALQESISWRVTAPLRWVGSLAHDPTPRTLKLRAKVLLQHAALYIGRRPHLKNAAMHVLRRFPNIKTRLAQTIRQATTQPSQLPVAQFHNMHADVTQLTPYARRIYADLITVIERRAKENS